MENRRLRWGHWCFPVSLAGRMRGASSSSPSRESPDGERNALAVPSSSEGNLPAVWGWGGRRRVWGRSQECPQMGGQAGSAGTRGSGVGAAVGEAALPCPFLAVALGSAPTRRGAPDPPRPCWVGRVVGARAAGSFLLHPLSVVAACVGWPWCVLTPVLWRL